jgi:hypothetical protein
VVPDAAPGDFFAGSEIIDYETAYQRSLEALRELAPEAERTGVTIGIENIWKKFLLSPLELRDFIDAGGSGRVGVFFDGGNAVANGYPEQWIRILGRDLHAAPQGLQAGRRQPFRICRPARPRCRRPSVMRALAALAMRAGPMPRCARRTASRPADVRHAATAMDQILAMGAD